MLKNKILFFLVLTILFNIVFTIYVKAQDEEVGSTAGETQTVTLENPLGATVTPQALIGRVINAVLGIVGSLALAMFIYGGLVWMTSAGSPEKVQKGKDVLIWAALGLIIIFASYALVNFVIFTAIKGV